MTDITYRRPIAWESAALTHEGCVRPANEDAILDKPNLQLWAVADGMGGHQVGDIASAQIIAALDALQESPQLSDAVNIIEDCLQQVNQVMLQYADTYLDGNTMGSTLVCTVIKGRIGACLWVGDSRLYRYRNHQLQQITRDHSQLEEMIELGLITKEDAEHHPNRNVITRAIGVEPQLYVDVTVFSTQVGDTFLLCSDGLYTTLSDTQISACISGKDCHEGAQQLLDQALEHHARDNVSVVVVKGAHGKVSPAALI